MVDYLLYENVSVSKLETSSEVETNIHLIFFRFKYVSFVKVIAIHKLQDESVKGSKKKQEKKGKTKVSIYFSVLSL